MQQPAVSRVSTVVDVDLDDRSYPFYIGPSLLDEPELLQRSLESCFVWSIGAPDAEYAQACDWEEGSVVAGSSTCSRAWSIS
jgi:hypothetical protein